MKNFYFLSIFFLTVYPTMSQGVWTKKADFGGDGRYFAASFSIGNKGYVGTGETLSGQTQDFWEYDPLADFWTQKANFGGGPSSNGYGLSIGSKGYIILSNWGYSGFWEYNPLTNTWAPKATLGWTARPSGACFSINNKGYVVCQFGNCWEYDPANDNWTQKANSDTAFGIGFSIGSKGYAGMGSANYINNYFAEYDPSTNVWTTKANFAGGGRAYAAGFSIGSKGYIGTGYSWDGLYKDFWEYDPLVDSWTRIADISSGGTAFATGFSIGNRGYVACGQDNTGYSKTLWELYPDIALNVSSGDSICSNQCNGTASASLTLGTPPYSFLWNTNPQQTTAVATGLCPGTYSVTVTDSVTSIIGSVTINPVPVPGPMPICMITVDSNSQNNIIIWDKNSVSAGIDSFVIYREIATNNYQPIGAIPYDSLSLFVDTVRSIYFPNSGNPNAGSYRYKIKAVDSCGNYSSYSPYHNTIFISGINGIFSWAQPYSIENNTNSVSAYILMRDDYANGNWHAVNSVSGYQQSITDPDYAAWQATARWRVETQWSISCTPTFKSSAPYTSSFSNIYGNTPVSQNEYSSSEIINVYPIVSDGKFNFHISGISKPNHFTIRIFNLSGEIICEIKAVQMVEINISDKPSGLYIYQACFDGKIVYGKLIKE